MKLSWPLLILCSLPVLSQQRIELHYAPGDGTIRFPREASKVRNGLEYTLVLTGINSAHTAVVSALGSSEFVSVIPDLLRPVIPGIQDNSVFNDLDLDPLGEDRSFRHAQRMFRKLESVRELADALYLDTRFAPDTALAKVRTDRLLGEVQLGPLDALAPKIERAKFFVQALLRSHSAQIETPRPTDSQLAPLLTQYAELEWMAQTMDRSDYAKALDFIKKSHTAKGSLPIGRFRAERDAVDLKLQLTDTYTGESLYDGTLSFRTYANFSFDFSTGFFYSNLGDHVYYTGPRNAESVRLLREDVGEMDLSVGALAHYVYKFSPGFGAGIALGASISPFDGIMRYLLGPSFTIGHRKLFSLSLGLAVARLERLSDGVPGDGEGHYLPLGEPVTMVKKVDSGFFVGMTYNLNRRKP